MALGPPPNFKKFSITEDGIRLRRCIRWHISASREPLFSTGTLQKRVVLIRIFFAIWKDADPDIPILIEAKQEYEKLK